MVSVMSLFRGRKTEATGDVYAFARRIAGGESADLDRIQQAAFRADMSLPEFDRLVSLCEERRRLREQAARLPGIEAERSALGKKIAEANAVISSAEETYRKTMASIQPAKDAADGQYATASRAEASLTDDAMLPEPLVKQRKAAKARLFAASSAVREADTKRDAAERSLERAKEWESAKSKRNPRAEGDWHAGVSPPDATQHARNLERMPGAIAALEEQLPKLRAEHDAAAASLETIEVQCRDF